MKFKIVRYANIINILIKITMSVIIYKIIFNERL